MSLSALIRKRGFVKPANAIPAISAIQEGGESPTLARIATVAIATLQDQETIILTADNELVVLGWLKLIGEDDPVMVDDVLDRCQTDPEALTYFLWRAAGGDK